ncbi:MAG: hypothetical protein DLM59_16365 [Pseudonocardiales bacterium]|nr:MAG: hypothetical protein DLM59_16365 [Pseudonocardiales bacterium]
MPEISVDPASLTALSKHLTSLVGRTDAARRTAIGCSDWDRSVVHAAALGAEVDWFYRRTVQTIETLRDLMFGEARGIAVAHDVYTDTDQSIQHDIDPGPPGRMRRTT